MRPALPRRTDGHALPARARAAASLVAVLLAGFAAGGCAAKGHGEMTLQSAKRDAEFQQTFTNAYVMRGETGDIEVLMHGDVPCREGNTPEAVKDLRQVVHVKVLWSPSGIYNADKLGATNAAVKWYVFREGNPQDLLEYAGTAMVRVKPEGQTVDFTIHNAQLQPSRQRGNLHDPVGPTKVEGKIVARRDSRRAGELLALIRNTASAPTLAQARDGE